MLLEMLLGKIHRATVTGTKIHYEGSIAVDPTWIAKAGLYEYLKVAVYNINNGSRFETYLVNGKKGAREVIVMGAAARLVMPGDRIIIAGFALAEPAEVKAGWKPKVVVLNEQNQVVTRAKA
jgi:aspartate 1-decarboxylase